MGHWSCVMSVKKNCGEHNHVFHSECKDSGCTTEKVEF